MTLKTLVERPVLRFRCEVRYQRKLYRENKNNWMMAQSGSVCLLITKNLGNCIQSLIDNKMRSANYFSNQLERGITEQETFGKKGIKAVKYFAPIDTQKNNVIMILFSKLELKTKSGNHVLSQANLFIINNQKMQGYKF